MESGNYPDRLFRRIIMCFPRSQNAVGIIFRLAQGRVGVVRILLLNFVRKDVLRYVGPEGLDPEDIQYRLPGGGCEDGESPGDCIRREAPEETGGGITIPRKTPLIQLGAIEIGDHVKNGLLVAASGCRGPVSRAMSGDLYIVEKKIVIVGFEWVSFPGAHLRIQPSRENSSQHTFIVRAEQKLIQMGLLDPNVPQD